MLGLKKVLAMILITVLFSSSILVSADHKAEAATLVYISVENFSEYLAKELDLSAIEGSYISALIEKSIIKDGDFTSYQKNITRGDALVLLNRADEYLYGDTLDAELVQTVISKRISDINKVSTSKQTEVAKAYLKGYMSGYSNGNYCTDRDLRLTKKITISGAVECIAKLNDKSKRAKISPDGQLIRTTKLPKYAKYYPYILASFPNDYYDWKFMYEGQVIYYPETGKSVPYENIKDYAAPVDIDKISSFEGNFKSVKDEYLDTWVGKARIYMECVFNADYRSIDDEWIDKILSADYSDGDETLREQTKAKIETYIKNMKKNKTIVESNKIAVDGSSLYYVKGRYVLRVYVKYRIVSSDIKYGVDVDTLIEEKPYNNILYTSYPLVSLKSYKIGKWKESYFDVDLSCYFEETGDSIGIFFAYLNELYYDVRRID